MILAFFEVQNYIMHQVSTVKDESKREIPMTAFLYRMMATSLVVLLSKLLLAPPASSSSGSSTKPLKPVLLTTLHMAGCTILTWGMALLGAIKVQRLTSKWQAARMLALSTVSALSMVLGNASLRYLPISFTQALGATGLVFTAVFARVLQGALVWLSIMLFVLDYWYIQTKV